MQQAAASPNFVEPILLPIADCIEVAICQPLPTHTRHIGTYNPTFFFYKQNFFLWDKVKGRTGCFEIGSTTDYQILFSYFERNFDIQGNTYCF